VVTCPSAEVMDTGLPSISRWMEVTSPSPSVTDASWPAESYAKAKTVASVSALRVSVWRPELSNTYSRDSSSEEPVLSLSKDQDRRSGGAKFSRLFQGGVEGQRDAGLNY